MTTPRRPSSSPDDETDLAGTFNVLIQRLTALEGAIDNQTAMTRAQLDIQQRYMTGPARREGGAHADMMMAQYQPRMRDSVLRELAASGGLPQDTSAGMTRVTRMNALASLQGLQRWGAQRMGEMIAREPLYEQSGPQAGGRGGSTGGGTVPGGGAPVPPRPAGPTVSGTGGPGAGWPGFTLGPVPIIPAPSGPAMPVPGAGGAPAPGAPGGGLRGWVPGVPLPVIPPGGGGGPGGGGPGGPGGGGPGGGGPGGPGGGGPGGPRGGGPNPLLRNIGARVAMTGGTLSGIGSMLRRIPGVGLAMDVASAGAEFYTNQREAGRVYQEAEGGSNLSAQTERLHNLIYQASMFGRMPEGAAAQAFGQVTGMGYNQAAVNQGNQLQNRQSALNFIYGNYTKTGMTVDESVAVLESASQSAQVSLQSVGDALNQLSATAGKAGTNAQQARSSFTQLLQTAIAAGGGAASPQLAGSLANMQASYGKSFAGGSFSGLLGPQMQYLLAGQYGINPAQVQSLQTNQPKQYANMLSGMAQQQIKNYVGSSPGVMQGLQQMIQQVGGYAQIQKQPALAQQVGQQFLQQYQASNPYLDTNAMAQYFSQFAGKQLDQNTVMQWIVEQLAGNGPAGSANVGAGPNGAPVRPQKGTGGAGLPPGTPTGKGGLAVPQSYNFRGRKISFIPGWQAQLSDQGSNQAAVQQYLSQYKSSGSRSPVLESLLQNVPQNSQVAVQTSSGVRVMSFSDAMKYYPNELQSGQVDFYNQQGLNLGGAANFTQGMVNSSANMSSEIRQKAGSNAGVSISQWQRQHPGSSGGGVTVDLSQEARQLLKLLPSSNNQAASQSTVPATTYVQSPSR